jgi:hypothetical protein
MFVALIIFCKMLNPLSIIDPPHYSLKLSLSNFMPNPRTRKSTASR